jgi:hypothetical protein
MSIHRKLAGVVLCLALASCNRANVPERGTRLASLARGARLNGQSTAEFSCPAAQAMTLGDLAQATKYSTVALLEPVAQVVSPTAAMTSACGSSSA